jgi:predicted Rossmann fold nucleotide-binding protein DprA/Smf involved in DNA uptake
MKLAVVGSRTFNNYEFFKDKLDQLSVAKIISGGARGADQLAERYAKEKGISFEIYSAKWKQYGRAAGPIRNEEIVKNC